MIQLGFTWIMSPADYRISARINEINSNGLFTTPSRNSICSPVWSIGLGAPIFTVSNHRNGPKRTETEPSNTETGVLVTETDFEITETQN